LFFFFFITKSFRDVVCFGDRGWWLDGPSASRIRWSDDVHDGHHGYIVMGRFHLPDWCSPGCTSGRTVIPDLRPQEVLAVARNSHDAWMAINRDLRESRKFIIK